MFLNALSSDDKKEFLSLLYFAANVDGEFTDIELSHISSYAIEMGISQYDKSNSSLEESINYFKSRPDVIKKIVLAEIAALVHCDKEFHSAEKDLITSLENQFSLRSDFKNEIIDWVENIRPLYKQGFQLVGLA